MAKESPNNQDRQVAHVPLRQEATEFLETLRAINGIVKIEGITRIIEWFSSLDKITQAAVLNGDKETRQRMARSVLREMAGESASVTEFGKLESLSVKQLVSLQQIITDLLGKYAEKGQKK